MLHGKLLERFLAILERIMEFRTALLGVYYRSTQHDFIK